MELNNDKTSIEYFNDYTRDFVRDVQSTFPEYAELLGEYYEDILTDESQNTDKHVKRFMRKMKDFKNEVASKSPDLYKEPVFILKNLDFKILFESEDLSEESREKMWDYIQTLFVLGESIINDSERVKKLVRNFKRLRNPEEVTQSDTSSEAVTETAEEEEPDDEDRQILEMLKNLSERKPEKPLDENMFENGMIGKLAQELSEELDIEKMGLNISEEGNVDSIFSNLLSGDNPMKFMNLIQTVGKKIQTKMDQNGLDQEALVNEATSMMSNLQGNNSMFDNLMKQAGNLGGMGMGAQNNSNTGSNATRDRLKKKLDARKNKNN
jgi:uncharacterized protein YdcH (DUF465 family)